MFKEFCKQCRYVKFMGIMTTWPEQKTPHRTTQKHVEPPMTQQTLKKTIFGWFLFGFSFFILFIFIIS